MFLGVFIQISGLLFNFDGSRYATQLYLVLFVPALVVLLLNKAGLSIWAQVAGLLFLALLCWVLFAAFFNSGTVRGVDYWFKIALLLSLYVFSVANLVRNERILKLVVMAVFLVAALFAGLTLFYQFAVLDRPLSYPEIRYHRFSELGWGGLADLGHPVIAGLYYGVFAVLACWIFIHSRLRSYYVVGLVICSLGICLYILFTFSRGAWFSLAASVFALLLITWNKKSKVMLAGALLVSVSLIFYFWSEVQSEYGVGLSNREYIWANWIDHFEEFWIAGAGAGARLFYRFSNGFEVFHAHSLYLQLWYEYGIIGISLFVALLLSLLWKGWQCREQPIARLGLALLVFAMVAMISDVYAIFHRPSPYWVIVWFPVGILLGVQPKREQAIN
jgi:putative inorganic carbon (HCO3(-)) transporter